MNDAARIRKTMESWGYNLKYVSDNEIESLARELAASAEDFPFERSEYAVRDLLSAAGLPDYQS